MKKMIVSIILFFLFMMPIVLALPVIESVSIQPSSAWLGEDVSISVNCSDNENKSIKQVYADISGPDIILPTQHFNNYSVFWSKKVDKNYLYKTGTYNVNIFCVNNVSNSTSTSSSFQVSKLTGYITDINPDPIYVGDEIEIYFVVKKNTADIYSNVTFDVKIDGQSKSLLMDPPYEIGKGWILKINSPASSGIYDLDVTAFYDTVSVTYSDSIEVKSEIELDIISINKEWIKYNDDITVKLEAKDRGNIITLNENNLEVEISSIEVDITSIEKYDGGFNVKFKAPNVAYGKYELKAILDYKGYSYSDSITVSYVVPIEGKIVDSDNKGISTKISFLYSNIEKLKLTTDSSGSYSGSLPPDTYDIKVVFPDSTLYLESCIVNIFNDPIKYFYSSSFDVPGIKNAGLFDYEVALTFSKATIEMEYEEKNVVDETVLKVFKCSNWNSGIRICNGEWEEVGGEIDTVRNLMKVELTELSAFSIGIRRNLFIDFSFDKNKYYLEDKVKVSGIVKDVNLKTVENATVELIVQGEGAYGAITDNNGIFLIEFDSPEKEGNYSVFLNIEKYPYLDYSAKKNLEVVSSKIISITFPDTIKIKQGENLTQEFSLKNTGQANLYDLEISLTGIPESYYDVISEIERLKVGEDKKLIINFFIPSNAGAGTSSASLMVSNDYVTEEKIFGFSITGEITETVTPEPLPPTGFIVLPELGIEVIYIILFAVFCFSMAIIVKKLRVRNPRTDRGEIRRFLFSVKGYLKRKDIKISKTESKENYDKLISSVFPNALKKLTKKLVGDFNGKNN